MIAADGSNMTSQDSGSPTSNLPPVNQWVIMAILLVIVFVLWLFIPWIYARIRFSKMTDAKNYADAEDGFRRTLGQFFAGVAFIYGAYITFEQLKISYNQMNIARYQATTSADVARNTLIDNQMAEGLKKLAAESDIEKIGGVILLHNVLNSSQVYRIDVAESLRLFICSHYFEPSMKPTPITAPYLFAIRVLFDRPKIDDGDNSKRAIDYRHINLSACNLNGADLDGADLTGTILDSANLNGSDLRGAHFSGASMKSTIFGNTKEKPGFILSPARLSRSADLRGATVTQTELNLACGDKTTLLDKGLSVPDCPIP